MAPNNEPGLLPISVQLSTDNITAGRVFSLYVLVTNPYNVPVYISNVSTTVPTEITLPQWTEAEELWKKELERKKVDQQAQIEKSKQELEAQVSKIHGMQQQLAAILKQTELTNDGMSKANFKERARNLSADIEREKKLNAIYTATFNTLIENRSKLSLDIGDGANVGAVDITDITNASIRIINGAVVRTVSLSPVGMTPERLVDLSSSLPKNTPLQPHSTANYTINLRTKSEILFRPAQYKLYFNVAYELDEPNILKVNTIATDIYIQGSITSVMLGALVGGLAGSIAHQAQIVHSLQDLTGSIFNFLIAMVLAVILSGITVVFIARKSNVQSFVTVEDFWGGIVVGFLIGYSGVTAFQHITGVNS